MRAFLPILSLAALAACNGQEEVAPVNDAVEAPAAAETTAAETSPAETSQASNSGPVLLSGKGIGWGSGADKVRLAFGSSRDTIDTALTAHFGAAPETLVMGECGAGPMESSSYPGGLILNYQNGELVGWFLDGSSERVALEGGLGIGVSGDRLAALAGFAPVEESTLGEEFYSEADGLGGFIEEGKVASLYAGTTCFFR